jgi:hypothetical protein
MTSSSPDTMNARLAKCKEKPALSRSENKDPLESQLRRLKYCRECAGDRRSLLELLKNDE